ncbi:hypothetical protein GQX74_010618 [Glossina fuscipes]|nr:hypothetical protein GQX74_010618 [Glossina fuscipes]
MYVNNTWQIFPSNLTRVTYLIYKLLMKLTQFSTLSTVGEHLIHKYSLKMNNRNQKKVKRKTITLETKIAILNRLANGEGSTALGKEYKLGESTIRAIQKRAKCVATIQTLFVFSLPDQRESSSTIE